MSQTSADHSRHHDSEESKTRSAHRPGIPETSMPEPIFALRCRYTDETNQAKDRAWPWNKFAGAATRSGRGLSDL